MEIYEKLRTRPVALVLTAVGLALLLVTILSLSLSARAEPAADLDVSKTVNTGQAAPGDTLTYTIHITNNVQVNFALWMTDTLPPEVDYVADSLQVIPPGTGSAGIANDVLTWTAASFGWNQQVIIVYSAQISTALASATITNTAEVTGTGSLVTSNMVSTGVSPGELQVSKEAGSSFARPGEQLGYTIHIANVGGGAVSAVSMTDPLPPEVSYVSGPSVSGWGEGSCGVSGDFITCTGRMESGEAATIDFTVVVSAGLSEGTYFTNTVYVSGAGLPLSASVAMQVNENMMYYLPMVMYNYPPVVVMDPIEVLEGIVYTVTWDCGSCELQADQFVLQEATDADFTQNVTEYTTTATSRFFSKGSSSDIYFYKVRADGDWGQGQWSNVESIGFYDEFDDASTGWPDDRGVMYVGGDGVVHYWWRKYLPTTGSGQYRILIDQGGPYAWFYQPFAPAPYVPSSNKYCIETEMKFEEGNMWANMGVVIGAHETDTQIYAFCMSRNNEDGLGWFLMRKDDYQFPTDEPKYRRGCSGPTFKIEGFAPAGQGVRTGTSRESWNRVRLGIDGDTVKVYIGNYYKGEATLAGLHNTTYIGLIGGDYELTPIDIRFDYFKVIQGSDCSY
ncbi:MAG: DUF11 domain-containing protein [Anaerolineae bacterium]|nr:DUF11 domain-containing protein [Anaerolineae bacterium]